MTPLTYIILLISQSCVLDSVNSFPSSISWSINVLIYYKPLKNLLLDKIWKKSQIYFLILSTSLVHLPSFAWEVKWWIIPNYKLLKWYNFYDVLVIKLYIRMEKFKWQLTYFTPGYIHMYSIYVPTRFRERPCMYFYQNSSSKKCVKCVKLKAILTK